MQTMRETMTSNRVQSQRPGEFFQKLSPAALRDLESMEFPTLYQPGVLLFSEKSEPSGIFIVVSRRSEALDQFQRRQASEPEHRQGRRNARTLFGAVGLPSEMTAETLYPVADRHHRARSVRRIHGPASRGLPGGDAGTEPAVQGCLRAAPHRGSRQLGAREAGAPAAGVERERPEDRSGTRLRFSLTHEEIGEFIGASRETVTRTLSNFQEPPSGGVSRIDARDSQQGGTREPGRSTNSRSYQRFS